MIIELKVTWTRKKNHMKALRLMITNEGCLKFSWSEISRKFKERQNQWIHTPHHSWVHHLLTVSKFNSKALGLLITIWRVLKFSQSKLSRRNMQKKTGLMKRKKTTKLQPQMLSAWIWCVVISVTFKTPILWLEDRKDCFQIETTYLKTLSL